MSPLSWLRRFISGSSCRDVRWDEGMISYPAQEIDDGYKYEADREVQVTMHGQMVPKIEEGHMALGEKTRTEQMP